MKTYRNLYDEMLDINNIIAAIEKASEKKTEAERCKRSAC